MMTKYVVIVLIIILVTSYLYHYTLWIQIIRELSKTKLILNKFEDALNKFEDKINKYDDTSWIPFPENTPISRGWYICTIRYGTNYNQTYVMDLFWDDKVNEWHDNRRIDVFRTYSVYNVKNERLHGDHYCNRKDVIAFKPIPDVYR